MTESRTLTAEWGDIRESALERDKWDCQYCGIGEPIADLEVHHIKPVKNGGKDRLGNLTTLCNRCHTALHTLTTGPEYHPSDLDEVERGIVLDQLDRAILDYLTSGRDDNQPWGIATPAVVRAALQTQGYDDVPVRQTINNRLRKLELAGHLNNRFGKGEYVLVSDPRDEAETEE